MESSTESRRHILSLAAVICAVILALGWMGDRASVWKESIFQAYAEKTEGDGFSLEVISVSMPAKRQKRVYVYHTHTYEAYEMEGANRYIPTETWRT